MTETNVSFRNLSPLVSILGPPVAILVLIWMMSLEGFFIEGVRIENFGESTFVPQDVHHDTAKAEDAH
jgi:cytochrome c oxidase subunit IV